MEAILMSAGIMTVIILCIVGIVKLPFDKFKSKHPNWYKATFTLLSIILTFGACLINQLFILESTAVFDINFAIMLLSTIAGVFGLYHSYEGLGVKELFKRLFTALKDIKTKAPENKLSKYIDKVGIDVALNIINAKQSEVTQVEKADIENAIVENQIINAEHIEVNNANVTNSTINTQN